jgi:DNA-binding protein HU-beta
MNSIDVVDARRSGALTRTQQSKETNPMAKKKATRKKARKAGRKKGGRRKARRGKK